MPSNSPPEWRGNQWGRRIDASGIRAPAHILGRDRGGRGSRGQDRDRDAYLHLKGRQAQVRPKANTTPSPINGTPTATALASTREPIELDPNHPLIVEMAQLKAERERKRLVWAEFAENFPEDWRKPESPDRQRWNEEWKLADEKLEEVAGLIALAKSGNLPADEASGRVIEATTLANRDQYPPSSHREAWRSQLAKQIRPQRPRSGNAGNEDVMRSDEARERDVVDWMASIGHPSIDPESRSLNSKLPDSTGGLDVKSLENEASASLSHQDSDNGPPPPENLAPSNRELHRAKYRPWPTSEERAFLDAEMKREVTRDRVAIRVERDPPVAKRIGSSKAQRAIHQESLTPAVFDENDDLLFFDLPAAEKQKDLSDQMSRKANTMSKTVNEQSDPEQVDGKSSPKVPENDPESKPEATPSDIPKLAESLPVSLLSDPESMTPKPSSPPMDLAKKNRTPEKYHSEALYVSSSHFQPYSPGLADSPLVTAKTTQSSIAAERQGNQSIAKSISPAPLAMDSPIASDIKAPAEPAVAAPIDEDDSQEMTAMLNDCIPMIPVEDSSKVDGFQKAAIEPKQEYQAKPPSSRGSEYETEVNDLNNDLIREDWPNEAGNSTVISVSGVISSNLRLTEKRADAFQQLDPFERTFIKSLTPQRLKRGSSQVSAVEEDTGARKKLLAHDDTIARQKTTRRKSKKDASEVDTPEGRNRFDMPKQKASPETREGCHLAFGFMDRTSRVISLPRDEDLAKSDPSSAKDNDLQQKLRESQEPGIEIPSNTATDEVQGIIEKAGSILRGKIFAIPQDTWKALGRGYRVPQLSRLDFSSLSPFPRHRLNSDAQRLLISSKSDASRFRKARIDVGNRLENPTKGPLARPKPQAIKVWTAYLRSLLLDIKRWKREKQMGNQLLVEEQRWINREEDIAILLGELAGL